MREQGPAELERLSTALPGSVWWAPGRASAPDAGTVAGGEDIGSTGAFVPVLEDDTALYVRSGPDDSSWFVRCVSRPAPGSPDDR